MKIHHLSVEEALATLQTTSKGLTGAEAKRRVAEFGRNVIEKTGTNISQLPKGRSVKSFPSLPARHRWSEIVAFTARKGRY